MKKVFMAALILFTGCAAAFGADAYSIKYLWPEKPKVGDYTLKVAVSDSAGKRVKDVDVVVSYYMPDMRGDHDASEKMKLSAKGYFLLPIHFAMRGDWEINLSVQKNGREASSKKIQLTI